MHYRFSPYRFSFTVQGPITWPSPFMREFFRNQLANDFDNLLVALEAALEQHFDTLAEMRWADDGGAAP